MMWGRRGGRRWSGGGMRNGGGVGMTAATFLAAVMLANGSIALVDRLSANLLRRDAEREAWAWAVGLSANLPDLPALLERRAPSPETLAGLAMARSVGGVFRYKIFDRDGELVFLSDDLDRTAAEARERDLTAHRGSIPVVARLRDGGDASAEAAAQGDALPPRRSAYYAEAHVPVMRDGAVVGAIEVYVDQTAQRARYEGAFLLTGILTGVLILASGLLPLGVAYHQARGRREAEALQALLAREVDHRAKNALAVVQSVLRLTPKGDAAAYARAVEGRVMALARAHALLAEGAWAGAELRVLAERELAPYTGPAAAAGALLEGPPVPIAAVAVQPLAVVLHELATNAAKHGALSAPGGRVRLTWSIEKGADLLRLRWAEEGGPAVAGPPRRRGFGSTAIEATARGQLGGTTALDWAPGGLRVDIALPLRRVLAPPSSSSPSPAGRPPSPSPQPGLAPRRPVAALPGTAA